MDKIENKILVTDLDGVLTDGRLTINTYGDKMFKQFHTRDVRAIRELIACAWEVYIVSADADESGQRFADKVGAQFIYLRDKKQIVDHWMKGRKFYCIGDDAWDIPMLELSVMKFCPNDATEPVKKLKDMRVLDQRGGFGVIAEFVYYFHLGV